MEPIIYPYDIHKIPLQKIDHEPLQVVQLLQQAGHVAYIVGGGVRDLLLEKTPKDYDISTSALPEQIKKLFRGRCILLGRRFRLAHIRWGKKVLEVSTFRAGDNETDQLITRDNEWGSQEQDVLRRDFTINALFYNPADQTVIDYVEGYKDLHNKRIRTIGDPYLRFKQDPVRMIRLIKFQARLDFSADREARMALSKCRNEIVKSSPARLLEEMLRMLESGEAKKFIQLMEEHLFLEHLLPSLSSFMRRAEGKETYLYLEAIDSINRKSYSDRSISLASLCFPCIQFQLLRLTTEPSNLLHSLHLYEKIWEMIGDLFYPFFSLPRKIRLKLSSILSFQFQITPLLQETGRIRIPNHPDFPSALEFLEIRSKVVPSLQESLKTWQQAYHLFKKRQSDKKKMKKKRS